jgi:hypothetical protein
VRNAGVAFAYLRLAATLSAPAVLLLAGLDLPLDIFLKLEVESRAQAVSRAHALGLTNGKPTNIARLRSSPVPTFER